MNDTSEKIFKSLAVLEQNLNGINSAKEQVAKVVKSSEDLAIVFETYKSSFGGISSNIKLMLDETKDLSSRVLSELLKQTDRLRDEISIFTGFNFDAKFQGLQQEVVKQFEKDLLSRLVYIDKKVQDMQVKIDEFKVQISRLEAINLEKHFNKHQEMLSKNFSAISSINLTLSNVDQSFNGIYQYLEKINSNQKEILNSLELREKRICNNIELSHTQILTSLSKNQSTILEETKKNKGEIVRLRKDIKFNRILIISSAILLIIILSIIGLKDFI